jgi:pentatricopeptide repeat protein
MHRLVQRLCTTRTFSGSQSQLLGFRNHAQFGNDKATKKKPHRLGHFQLLGKVQQYVDAKNYKAAVWIVRASSNSTQLSKCLQKEQNLVLNLGIFAASKLKDKTSALKFFGIYSQAGFRLHNKIGNWLIESHMEKSSDASAGIECFNTLVNMGMKPSLWNYNTFLMLLASKKEPMKALEIYKTIWEKGIRPDNFTFAQMFQALKEKPKDMPVSQYETILLSLRQDVLDAAIDPSNYHILCMAMFNAFIGTSLGKQFAPELVQNLEKLKSSLKPNAYIRIFKHLKRSEHTLKAMNFAVTPFKSFELINPDQLSKSTSNSESKSLPCTVTAH